MQLRSMAAVRPVRRAWAFDLDRAKARGLAARLSAELGIEVRDASNLEDSVERSQIVVTCTTSREPILGPGAFHPGLFIAAVGADNPDKQEVHPELLARCSVVVDSIDACATGGDLHHAIAAGLMTRDDVHGELSAVVAGRAPGRMSPDDVFVFDSTGTALQDVAAAVLVYERVREAPPLAVSIGAR
jgi:ornithine cyclodeaminase/alanine dehydrogenase-like protein (mu-crystallin family)